MSLATQAEIKRMIDAAKAVGMTIYGFAVDGKKITVFTQPMMEASKEDELERWLREQEETAA
ncbi:hypothetical protein [Ponticaulis sp.]|uniref:hypothetical protein n=1 Tax=Ponticaulis sp. TaxID=2020902 RepID=UPI000C37E39A|nr:hypothetical protein [Ponticaulis sp.]MBN04486.1 hypothetical protein [Ponticaulis sp.]